MIRFICVVLFVVGFLILSIPALAVEWILGKVNMEWKNRSSLAIIRRAFQIVLRITGVSVTVMGRENIPADEAVLFVGNHRSFFDILLIYTLMKRPTGFVAKKETGRIPLLRNWMANIQCLFLDRSDIRQGLQTILTGIEKMKGGISLVIFPEGTRNKTSEPFLPFHGGSFKLAEKSGCAVIPVAINNAADIFEDHFPVIRKTHVVMEFGEPIYPGRLGKEEKKKLPLLTESRIREMYFKNQELV